MKIGIYDPYLDDLGGGEKYMMILASCLAQKHEVTVLWDNQEDISGFKKRFVLSLEKVKVGRNIFSSEISLAEKIKDMQKYDAFIILSDGSIPFVFPKKLFLHIQQPLPKRVLFLKDKIKLKNVSAIFYNSAFTKHFNDSLFPGVKSRIIYPPVSLKNKNEKVKKENVIVHVGRFRVKNIINQDYKKQFFMIDAFKKLIDQGFKNWTFLLAVSVRKEDEDEFARMQKNAEGYPIEFQMNKTNSELFSYYNKAKIYWHASGYGEDLEKHPELAEHFGITTVEAMGSGAVPVVINSGGQREIVTDEKNGLLWNTEEELLNKTKKLATDEKLWHRLSQQAMIRAQEFSVERFCEDIHTLISL